MHVLSLSSLYLSIEKKLCNLGNKILSTILILFANSFISVIVGVISISNSYLVSLLF